MAQLRKGWTFAAPTDKVTHWFCTYPCCVAKAQFCCPDTMEASCVDHQFMALPGTSTNVTQRTPGTGVWPGLTVKVRE